MTEPKSSKSKAKADDAGQAEVAKQADAEQEAGLRGREIDETPNRNYGVPGKVAGDPTPDDLSRD